MFSLLKQLLSIISKKDRRKFVIILFLILISSFMDLIGISSIVPIITLLSAPDVASAIDGNIILRLLSSTFHTADPKMLSVIALLFIVFIYLVKIAYSFLLIYIKNKFTMSFNRRLRERLMKIYLAMPYEFHHENNSSTLIRKSTYDVDVFTGAVNGILDFIVYSTTITIIVVYLFISSYIITLIIGAFLLVFAIFILVILKKRTKKLGVKIQKLNDYNYQYLSQSFNGIKESKISNTEEYFVNQYVKNVDKINKYSLRHTMYSSIPGHTLEFIGILGMVVALLIIIATGDNSNYQIIGTFSLFAYAVIKLLPCVVSVTSYLNRFSFYSASIASINNDLKETEQLEDQIEHYGEHEHLMFNDYIELKEVSFAYKDAIDKLIVNNATFHIHKNTSVAVSGKSGAGKTTLVDIILGLLKPTNGIVSCDGVNINTNIRGWRDNISYVPQNIYLIDDTIRNNVVFGINANNIDDRRIWEALDKAQLREFVEKSPKGLDTVIGEGGIRLSGGQRQRIGIARAFYRNTNIIVLDEATSALDYETEKNILDHISQYSKDHTLIIITHRLNTIESCDYIYQIVDGNVKCIKGK